MRMRWAGAASILLAGTAWAQVPADLVPTNALVMAGWRGTLDPGPNYAGSKTAALLKDAQLGRFIDETLPAIGAAVARKEPADGPIANAVVNVIRQALRHPSAAFFGMNDEQPQGGIVVRAGADAAAVTQSLQEVVARLPQQAGARVVAAGDHVELLLGYAADAQAPGGGLDRSPLYQKGIGACVADASLVVHVDLDHARVLLEQQLQANAPAEVGQKVQRLLDASGLDGVHAYTAAAGFDGGLWRDDSFLNAPAPRKGLLDFAAAPAFDPTLLQRVPASANSVTVFNFDPVSAIASVRRVAADVDPQYGDLIDKVIGGATLAIGKNVQTDLLASMGTQWAAYTSPLIGGSTTSGIVLVNKLTDPLKAKQAMAAASIFLSNASRNFIPNKDITIAGRMIKSGDLSVFYVATPALSPAWTVKDGYLYLGLYPQTVIAAARFAGAPISESAAFAEATKLAGGTTPVSISYRDTKATLADGYQLVLLGERTLFGLSDVFLTATPEPMLPPLSVLQDQAAPVVAATWADADGLHQRSRSPFPGAGEMAGLSISDLYLTNVPMVTSVMLPSLTRAREAANRIKSASNLRQIGLACLMYSNENKDHKFPSDENELLHKEDITVDVFINPRRTTTKPPLPIGANAADFYGAWAAEHSDYVYLGAGMTDNANANHVVAYEKPAGLDDGINVLFADGHVDFVPFDSMEQVFKAGGADVPSR